MASPVISKKDPQNRDWFTVKEAAELAEVSVDFLYVRVKRPESGIPFRRRGWQIHFPKEPFLKWAKQDIIP